MRKLVTLKVLEFFRAGLLQLRGVTQARWVRMAPIGWLQVLRPERSPRGTKSSTFTCSPGIALELFAHQAVSLLEGDLVESFRLQAVAY